MAVNLTAANKNACAVDKCLKIFTHLAHCVQNSMLTSSEVDGTVNKKLSL